MTDPLKQHPKTSFKDISPFSSLGSLSYRPSPTFTLKRFLTHILKTHMYHFLQAGINSFYGNIPFGNTPGTCIPFASFLDSGIDCPWISVQCILCPSRLSLMNLLESKRANIIDSPAPQTSFTVVQYPV